MENSHESFRQLCVSVAAGDEGAISRFERNVAPLVEVLLRRLARKESCQIAPARSQALLRARAIRICRSMISKLVKAGRVRPETIAARLLKDCLRSTRRIDRS